MGHAYAHLWGIPTTMFRFFTVYGPWGRPDMALYKFVEAILKDQPIDIYNHGEMYRDFTYVADLVRGIRLLIDAVPPVRRSSRSRVTACPPPPRGASSTSAIPTRSNCWISSMRSKVASAARPNATTWTCRWATSPPHGPTPTC